MEKLFESIEKLKREYDSKREKDRFNIISIFHKEREEKLHSRVISYLLSPSSGHGMGALYCELFIRNVLKLNENELSLSDFKVLPNEEEKTEYKFIDILIINKSKSQAIIIENKIDANDSNHVHKSTGDESINFNIGQLDRYYNTIKTGKDKDGRSCPEMKCDNVFVYYLSPYGKEPSAESIRILKDISESWKSDRSIISYDLDVRAWLKDCIEKTPSEKALLEEFLKHYLKIVNKMTHNDISREERNGLKNIFGNNIQKSKYLMDNFKHVKWHTVYDFWQELMNQLKNAGYTNIEIYHNNGTSKDLKNPIFINAISQVTHFNKANLNHGFLFDLKNGNRAYISSLGRLSWGNQNLNKWIYFEQEINFSDFSIDSTYSLINQENMKSTIESIIKEISDSEKNGFMNLNPIGSTIQTPSM